MIYRTIQRPARYTTFPGPAHIMLRVSSTLRFCRFPNSQTTRFRVKKMSTAADKIPKLYRQLLKAVKKHHGVEDYNKHFKKFVTMQFRKDDAPHLDRRIKLAEDYIFQLNRSTFKDMFTPYNNVTRSSQELKKQVEKSVQDGFKRQESSGTQSANH